MTDPSSASVHVDVISDVVCPWCYIGKHRLEAALDLVPDIAVDTVFPSSVASGNTLVAVDLSNSGYAAAQVPITVRTADTTVTQRILVPARSKAVQRILIQGQPTEVQVNDGTVPETQASVHVTNVTAVIANPSSR